MGLEDLFAAAGPHGDPGPATHYYADSDTYFREIARAYFAGRPPHAAAVASESTEVEATSQQHIKEREPPSATPCRSNLDFRRLLDQKRKAATADKTAHEGVGLPKKRKRELVPCASVLCDVLT